MDHLKLDIKTNLAVHKFSFVILKVGTRDWYCGIVCKAAISTWHLTQMTDWVWGLGKQQQMPHVIGDLPPTRETCLNLLASSFGLAQHLLYLQLLHTSGIPLCTYPHVYSILTLNISKYHIRWTCSSLDRTYEAPHVLLTWRIPRTKIS